MPRKRVTLAALFLAPALAHGQTWNVNNNGSWQTAGNWNPAVVPNSSSSTAILGNIITAPRTVTLDAPVTLDSLRFEVNGANGYNLTSSAAGNTLTLNSIYHGHFTSTATTNLNLAANAAGNLIAGSDNGIFVSNYSSNGAALTIGATTTLATPNGTGGLSLANFNNANNVITVNGNIGAPGKGFSNIVIGGNQPGGPKGTVILRGDNSNSNAGALVLYGSNLVLDYSASNTNKVDPTKFMTMWGNSSVSLVGNAAVTSQAILQYSGVNGTGTFSFTEGAGGIQFMTGPLNLNSGAAVNFANLPTVGFVNNGNDTQADILHETARGIRGNVVVGGTTWASKTGSNISGLTTYSTNTFGLGQNTDVTTNLSPATFTTNTLRFNTAAATTLTLTGTNTVDTGGILNSSNVGANTKTITGGTLTSPGMINVLQFNTAAPLEIQSSISTSQLNKLGPGALTLSGPASNSGLTTLHVGTGTVNLAKPSGTPAFGNGLNVVGGTANIAANNTPTGGTIFLNETGHINFQGPQTLSQFHHSGGSYSNANLTLSTLLRLSGGNYSYNGTAYTLSGASTQLQLLQASTLEMTSTNVVGATPVFNLGGAVRDVHIPSQRPVTFNGPHFGNGGIRLIGGGPLTLNGVETYTGNTVVQLGGLYVNGTLASPVVVNSGNVGGTGTISQSVTATNGLQLSPGNYNPYYDISFENMGILTLGSLDVTATFGALLIDHFGTTPGTQHDQLIVNGTAAFGADFQLLVFDDQYSAPVGNELLIVQRGPGSLGFLRDSNGSGLPILNEGDIFRGYNPNNHYRISYAAGDGNDISLTVVAVPEPTTWALLAGSAALGGYFVHRRRQRQQAAFDADLST